MWPWGAAGRAEARWSMFECNSSSETSAGAYTMRTNTNEGTRVRQAAAARGCGRVGPTNFRPTSSAHVP